MTPSDGPVQPYAGAPPRPGEPDKAPVEWRVAAGVIGGLFALFVVAYIVGIVALAGARACDAAEDAVFNEGCYDSAPGEYTLSIVVGSLAAIAAIAALGLALRFVITGRSWGPMLIALGVAIVLGVAEIPLGG